jgi:polyisoprenoid-binding protein YceI
MEITKAATRTKWTLDPSHCEIGFKVKHMMITNVGGEFKDYNGSIYVNGEDFSNAEMDISISAASISTGDTKRDAHLKSPDFFDIEKYRQIKFKSISSKPTSKGDFILEGDLTIKSITKRISLQVTFNGKVKDSLGITRAGFEITGTINRRDFGLNWNSVIEVGGICVLVDEVIIKCEIQLAQQVES